MQPRGNSNRLTLEQQRAQQAWKVSARYGEKEANFAKSAPLIIMNSGLMQFLCFSIGKSDEKALKQPLTNLLQARGENDIRIGEHALISVDLCAWLARRFPDFPPEAKRPEECRRPLGGLFREILDWISRQQPAAYQHLTAEALAYLKWVRFMSEARLKMEGTQHAGASRS